MPETVVDGLEIVEIEKQHGERAGCPTRALQRMGKPVPEQRAVGQSCQRVVKSLVCELRFKCLALSNVAAIQHESADIGVINQVCPEYLDQTVRTVSMTDAPLDRRSRAAAADGVGQECGSARDVLAVQQVGQSRPDELLRLVAAYLLAGWADVLEYAAGVDRRDHVGCVLHQRPEAFLARGELLSPLDHPSFKVLIVCFDLRLGAPDHVTHDTQDRRRGIDNPVQGVGGVDPGETGKRPAGPAVGNVKRPRREWEARAERNLRKDVTTDRRVDDSESPTGGVAVLLRVCS